MTINNHKNLREIMFSSPNPSPKPNPKIQGKKVDLQSRREAEKESLGRDN